MSEWHQKDDEAEEENAEGENEGEGEGEGESWAGNDSGREKDRIICILDARSAMLEKNLQGDAHLKDALMVCLAVMKAKVMSGEDCMIGITFFGSEDKDPEASAKVLQWLPLDSPSAEGIRRVSDLVDRFDVMFPVLVGSDAEHSCPLREAFWAASSGFALKVRARSGSLSLSLCPSPQRLPSSLSLSVSPNLS